MHGPEAAVIPKTAPLISKPQPKLARRCSTRLSQTRSPPAIRPRAFPIHQKTTRLLHKLRLWGTELPRFSLRALRPLRLKAFQLSRHIVGLVLASEVSSATRFHRP